MLRNSSVFNKHPAFPPAIERTERDDIFQSEFVWKKIY
jgi:hypothetical protein